MIPAFLCKYTSGMTHLPFVPFLTFKPNSTISYHTLTLHSELPSMMESFYKHHFIFCDVSQRCKPINCWLPFLINAQAESGVELFVCRSDSFEQTTKANHKSGVGVCGVLWPDMMVIKLTWFPLPISLCQLKHSITRRRGWCSVGD